MAEENGRSPEQHEPEIPTVTSGPVEVGLPVLPLRKPPKFGFSGLSLLVGLVLFAIQQGCSVTGNAPSWIWGTVWFCLALLLVVLAIWFWDQTASHHWARKFVLTLAALILMGVFSYIPVSKQYRLEHRGAAITSLTPNGCAIKDQTQPLRATPMPAKATDQQLADETLVIVEHLLNFTTIYLNAQRTVNKNNHVQDCSLLQEYETALRIPAETIRQTMVERLSMEARTSLSSTTIPTIYRPLDVDSMSKIADDLLKVEEAFTTEKHIEAKTPMNQWIVPLVKEHIQSLSWTDAETQLSQTISNSSYTGEVRWIGLATPQSIQLLVVAKSLKPRPEDKFVRLKFDRPIAGMFTRNYSGAVIGYDYVDFAVNKSPLSASVEIWRFGGGEPRLLSIEGIVRE